jgi:hypothetical protein
LIKLFVNDAEVLDAVGAVGGIEKRRSLYEIKSGRDFEMVIKFQDLLRRKLPGRRKTLGKLERASLEFVKSCWVSGGLYSGIFL